MCRLNRVVLAIAALYELGHWTFELAGDPPLRLTLKGQKPKGEQALRDECGNRLPERIYDIFREAVAYHRREDYPSAYAEYKKLRSIPLRNGSTLDLFRVSKVFRYDWCLLLVDMKR